MNLSERIQEAWNADSTRVEDWRDIVRWTLDTLTERANDNA